MEEIFNDVKSDWLPILDIPLLWAIMEQLKDVNYTPKPSMIFEFAKTSFNKVRVVIIGQDPYPTEGHAMGLAFSSAKLPASVRNIFKCLIQNGIISEMPKNGLLYNWVRQGVCLLNVALTFPLGVKGVSHLGMWEKYTNHIISKLAELNPIFILWGNPAKKKRKLIPDCECLEWVHPSPMTGIKFLTCDNFVRCNEILQNRNSPCIDWHPMLDCIIATDGSCIPNNGGPKCRAGFAVIIPSYGIKIYGALVPPATNNRAEGVAIMMALKYLAKKRSWFHCFMIIDSLFWIKMLENYMPKWKEVDYQSHKNSDITPIIYRLWKPIKKNITLVHIKSHGKSGWKNGSEREQFFYKLNDDADKLANVGRKCQPGEIKMERI